MSADPTPSPTSSAATRAEYCAVAIAEAFRCDGEILCNPIGNLPLIGGRLARASFEPELAITDTLATLTATTPAVGRVDTERVVEHWNPYRRMFELLWNGRRHVMMGASQVDRYGNQNLAAIGDWHRPKAQLLGFRGAPGNTISHTTSYFVPNHSPKVLVEAVDIVSGVGYDRAAELGPETSRFHEIRRLVTNLSVIDFEASDEAGIPCARLRSVHPWATVDEVVGATGFELAVPDEVPESRAPTTDELALLRHQIDPDGLAAREVPNE